MKDSNSGKRVYRDTFEAIRNILNETDPVGLRSSGAPLDEYDEEASRIVALLNKELSEDRLTKEIHLIFENSFDRCDGDSEIWSEIALRIRALKIS